MSSLALDIQNCLKRVLGPECSYVNSPTVSKLMNGARIFRITGWGGNQALRRTDDGRVVYIDREGPFPEDAERLYREIEITRDNLSDEKIRKLQFSDWEYFLLEKGPEVVERELRMALAERGHAVEVKIGPGGAGDGPGAGSAYATSVRVKLLNQPMKPGAVADEAVLNELGAISSELNEVHATINSLALRVRSVLITMTLKARP